MELESIGVIDLVLLTTGVTIPRSLLFKVLRGLLLPVGLETIV